jgi:hypothetical protein
MVVEELEHRVKAGAGQLLTNDFSTTDVISKTASQIVLMDALKQYFDYTFSLMCGIPQVTLHGSASWRRHLPSFSCRSASTGGWTASSPSYSSF